MTLQEMKDKVKAAWQSQPMSIVLPIGAFGVYFWTHGHDFHSFKSFPTLGEWAAGIALLTTQFKHITDLIPGFNSASKDTANKEEK